MDASKWKFALYHPNNNVCISMNRLQANSARMFKSTVVTQLRVVTRCRTKTVSADRAWTSNTLPSDCICLALDSRKDCIDARRPLVFGVLLNCRDKLRLP